MLCPFVFMCNGLLTRLHFFYVGSTFLTGLIFLGAYTDLIYFLLEVWDSHLNLAVCCCDHCRGCMLKKV